MITLDNHTRKIQVAFNKAAHTYDAYCALQHEVGITLIEKLNHVISHVPLHHVADLGCGTGLITQQLIHVIKYQTVDAIDIAELLLEKAQATLASHAVRLIQLDFNHLDALNKSYDLIFSNMALQWSFHLDSTLEMINRCLTQTGYFAFSLPLKNTFCELPAYAKNTLCDFNKINDLLHAQHFDVIFSHEEIIIETFPDMLCALKSIKKVGANCITAPSEKRHLTKSHLKINTTSQLTYHIGYFIAKKNKA